MLHNRACVFWLVVAILLASCYPHTRIAPEVPQQEQGEEKYLQHFIRHQVKLRHAIDTGTVDCRQRTGWGRYILPSPVDQTGSPYFHLMRPWYGRFGNNVLQIRNALRYAICCQGTLRIDPFDLKYGQTFIMAHKLAYFFDFRPKHPDSRLLSSFDAPYLSRSSPVNKVGPFLNLTDKSIRMQIHSFSAPPACQGRYPLLSEHMSKPAIFMRNFSVPKCVYDEASLLQQVLFGNSRPAGCPPLGDKCGDSRFADALSLIIHIRSGDIFRYSPENKPVNASLQNTIKRYTQPPWIFYETILHARPWKHVLVVTSHETNHTKLNPVWKYLKRRIHEDKTRRGTYNGIPVKFQQSENDTADLETFLCARYFVKASSSLSEEVVRLSPYLREYYTPNDGIGSRCDNVRYGHTCHLLNLSVYYEAIGFNNWLNTNAQRDIMVKFRQPLPMTVHSSSL